MTATKRSTAQVWASMLAIRLRAATQGEVREETEGGVGVLYFTDSGETFRVKVSRTQAKPVDEEWRPRTSRAGMADDLRHLSIVGGAVEWATNAQQALVVALDNLTDAADESRLDVARLTESRSLLDRIASDLQRMNEASARAWSQAWSAFGE